MKKKIFATLMAIMLCVGVCFAFGGCNNVISGIENVVKPTYTIECRDNLYYVTVRGVLENKTNATYYCTIINFDCYDEDGNEIGSCSDDLGLVKVGEVFSPGEKWEYEATTNTGMEKVPVLVRFTGFSLHVYYKDISDNAENDIAVPSDR